MTYAGKTLFVNTGGTLSVNLNDTKKGLSVSKPYTVSKIIDRLFYNTQMVQPFTILSEQLTLENCKTILECIRQNNSYELIIVLHGTDRLTFSAQYLRRFYDPVCPILFLGCQRSPDMPTYELYPTLLKITKCISSVKRGIYIVNVNSEGVLQLLEPLNSQKAYSFNKNCFKGSILYEYQTNLVQRNSQKFKLYPVLQPPCKNICVLYLLPSIQYSIPLTKQRVIVVGTGLGNVDRALTQLAITHPSVKFYVCNTLWGPKAKIYGSNWPKNVYVSDRCPQLLYIDLLHNIPINNNYGT